MNENNLLILNNEGAFLNCIKLTEFIKKYDNYGLTELFNCHRQVTSAKPNSKIVVGNIYRIINTIIRHMKLLSGSERFLNWLLSLGNKVSIDDQLEEKIVSEIDNLLEENKKSMRNITKIMYGDYELDKLLYDMRFDENMIQFNFKLLAELIKNKDAIGLGTFISHIQDKCGDDIIYTNTVKLLQLIKDNIEILSEDEEIIKFFKKQKTYANAHTMSVHTEHVTCVINKAKKTKACLRNIVNVYDGWYNHDCLYQDYKRKLSEFIGLSESDIGNPDMEISIKNLFANKVYEFAKDNKISEIVIAINKIKNLNDLILNSNEKDNSKYYLELYDNIELLYNKIHYIELDKRVDLFSVYAKFINDNVSQSFVNRIDIFDKAFTNYCRSLNK